MVCTCLRLIDVCYYLKDGFYSKGGSIMLVLEVFVLDMIM